MKWIILFLVGFAAARPQDSGYPLYGQEEGVPAEPHYSEVEETAADYGETRTDLGETPDYYGYRAVRNTEEQQYEHPEETVESDVPTDAFSEYGAPHESTDIHTRSAPEEEYYNAPNPPVPQIEEGPIAAPAPVEEEIREVRGTGEESVEHPSYFEDETAAVPQPAVEEAPEQLEEDQRYVRGSQEEDSAHVSELRSDDYDSVVPNPPVPQIEEYPSHAAPAPAILTPGEEEDTRRVRGTGEESLDEEENPLTDEGGETYQYPGQPAVAAAETPQEFQGREEVPEGEASESEDSPLVPAVEDAGNPEGSDLFQPTF